MNLQQNRGFTLLEVLVALAVLAIVMGAIIKAVAESVDNLAYLRDKTVASWVALNKINEVRLQKNWSGSGTTQGSTEMADREWHWELRISKTADQDLRRLDIAVRSQINDPPLVELIAFRRSASR